MKDKNSVFIENLGLFCPRCQHGIRIQELEVSASMIISMQDYDHRPKLNIAPKFNQGYGWVPGITFGCTRCGFDNMVMIDSHLIELIEEFQKMKLFTKFSYDGGKTLSPYICFHDSMIIGEIITSCINKYWKNITYSEDNEGPVLSFSIRATLPDNRKHYRAQFRPSVGSIRFVDHTISTELFIHLMSRFAFNARIVIQYDSDVRSLIDNLPSTLEERMRCP